MMKITVINGNILDQKVDAIVNAANSFGYMGGGVAAAIKRAGGNVIEVEAIKQAPIPIGKAVLTTGGSLPFKIIHAPTMRNPGDKTTAEKIRAAVRSALELADKSGFGRIALPGMGTGVGRVPEDIAAKAMLQEIESFHAVHLKEIVLVDISDKMVQAFKRYLG
ncbi:MAG: macro domain-containing protein [Candidatus Micrarchaeia archaeon]